MLASMPVAEKVSGNGQGLGPGPREAGENMLEIEQLRTFSHLPAPLLTVYLDSNPGKASNRGPSPEYLTWLNSAGKAIAPGIPPGEQKSFSEQWGRVRAFLRDRPITPRGAVIFAGANLWNNLALEVDVENELHWGKPLLFPLLGLVSRHKPCAVVVVDRAGARFFRYRLGEMTELEQRKFDIDISHWRKKDMGKVSHPGIKKTRGSDRDAFERRVEAQYQRLCGEIADRARELSGQQRLTELFLVGSERLVEPIVQALPRGLQPRVVKIEEDLGRIVSPVLEGRIEPAVAQWEQGQESEMVAALLGTANGAVSGIDPVLAELQQGRVRIIVVAQTFDCALSQCVACGWTDRSGQEVCPVCGAARRNVKLRETLPELAWSHGAEIEIVGGEASRQLMQAGGIAAWLRQAAEANISPPAAQAG